MRLVSNLAYGSFGRKESRSLHSRGCSFLFSDGTMVENVFYVRVEKNGVETKVMKPEGNDSRTTTDSLRIMQLVGVFQSDLYYMYVWSIYKYRLILKCSFEHLLPCMFT